jgi:hypothetical protein
MRIVAGHGLRRTSGTPQGPAPRSVGGLSPAQPPHSSGSPPGQGGLHQQLQPPTRVRGREHLELIHPDQGSRHRRRRVLHTAERVPGTSYRWYVNGKLYTQVLARA